MLLRINHTFIYVIDLARAIEFYTQKLGFNIASDVIFEKQRWVTISLPNQHELQVMLITVEKGLIFKSHQVKTMQEMIRQGVFSFAVFECTDLKATYEELKSKGVKFLMEPSNEGFMNQYEAAILDDSGNWFRLTEKSKSK